MTEAKRLIGPRTKLLAITMMSNALGTIVPVEELAALAHAQGATVLVDGAQGVPHLPTDVVALGADFLAFSAHKMLGPTGIGVLWGKRERLKETEPLLLGGGMVREVFADRATYLEVTWTLEVGKPTDDETVGVISALDYIV